MQAWQSAVQVLAVMEVCRARDGVERHLEDGSCKPGKIAQLTRCVASRWDSTDGLLPASCFLLPAACGRVGLMVTSVRSGFWAGGTELSLAIDAGSFSKRTALVAEPRNVPEGPRRLLETLGDACLAKSQSLKQAKAAGATGSCERGVFVVAISQQMARHGLTVPCCGV